MTPDMEASRQQWWEATWTRCRTVVAGAKATRSAKDARLLMEALGLSGECPTYDGRLAAPTLVGTKPKVWDGPEWVE